MRLKYGCAVLSCAALALLLLACGVPAAEACVGARPLAMGGAFIGLADDVNATYWNPAGLVQLKPGASELTWMHTSSNRDKINYQDYAAFAMRADTPKLKSRLAFGASHIKDKLAMLDSGEGEFLTNDRSWFWLSLAADLGDYGTLGLNVRRMDSDMPGYSVDSQTGLDLAYHYRVNSQVSVGLLVQDINKPRTTVKDVGSLRSIRNWRPGIAFRPREDTVVTADIYDLADDGDARSLHIGAERQYGKITARAGLYGLGASDARAFTFGAGLSGRTGSFDLAVMTGDIDTVLLSATLRFD